MKKNRATVVLLLLLFCSTASSAQLPKAGVRLVSESKELFREDDMLKQIADDVYFSKVDLIKEKVTSQIAKDIRSITDQNTRAENIQPSVHTSVEIVQKNGQVVLRYTIPLNNVQFHVTTPKVLGVVGVDRALDPSVWLTYKVVADFPLKQSGSAESIKFLNPVWTIGFTRYSGTNLQRLSLDKTDLEVWATSLLQTSFHPIYVSLHEITGRLNDYLSQTIINHAALQKEFELDENRQLTAVYEEGKNLIRFVHSYSKAGITKRASSDKASDLTKETRAVPERPGVTTSASVLTKPAAGTGTKVKTSIRRN